MKFIVVDGLDGCGKDTQSLLIKDKYEAIGENVILRTHPSTDNRWGLSLKECLLKTGKINHAKAAIYYILDVLRSLRLYYNENTDTLIFVRYSLGVAYIPYPLGKYIYKLICLFLPKTEYMFFIDVQPEELMNRLIDRGEKLERFENIEDLKKTQDKAKKITNDWNIINGHQSVESINYDVNQILTDLDSKTYNLKGNYGILNEFIYTFFSECYRIYDYINSFFKN